MYIFVTTLHLYGIVVTSWSVLKVGTSISSSVTYHSWTMTGFFTILCSWTTVFFWTVVYSGTVFAIFFVTTQNINIHFIWQFEKIIRSVVNGVKSMKLLDELVPTLKNIAWFPTRVSIHSSILVFFYHFIKKILPKHYFWTMLSISLKETFF